VSKWIEPDRTCKRGYRWTPEGKRAWLKWTVLLGAWLVIILSASWAGNGLIPLAATLTLAGYAVYRAVVNRPRPFPTPAATVVKRQAAATTEPATVRFNPPPGWPLPPQEWQPPADWEPDPLWEPPPPGWQLWVPNEIAPFGERDSRAIPQDVKIEVAHRDEGKCRQCGSTAELQFDRVIPWSKGGANTVTNVQLLCGPCNRLKDTYEILAGM
jgi:hypothetical protein